MSEQRAEQFAAMRALRLPAINRTKGGVLKSVLRTIHDHAGAGGKCWASIATLAEESCFSRRTVIRATADLESANLITAIRLDGRTTTYQLNWKELAKYACKQCQRDTSASGTPVPAGHLTSASGSKTSASGSKTSASGTPKTIETNRNHIQLRARAFQEFWDAYPSRNGRKLGRDQAEAQFAKLNDSELPSVMRAVRNLATSEQLPKDAHRWLRNKDWREWLEPAVSGNGHDPAHQPFQKARRA